MLIGSGELDTSNRDGFPELHLVVTFSAQLLITGIFFFVSVLDGNMGYIGRSNIADTKKRGGGGGDM
jgi:hypothetical protein